MTILVGLLLAVPLAGACLMLAGRRADGWAVATFVGATSLELALAVILAAIFPWQASRTVHGSITFGWIKSLGLVGHWGVDGMSIPLLVLTSLLCLCCAVYSLRHVPDGGSRRAYVGLFLLLQAGLIGTFVALDLLSFFVFFEVVLVPMWFLIAWWGEGDSRRSATVFIVYTVSGSALMLSGFLWLWAVSGTTDIVRLTQLHGSGLSGATQLSIAVLIGVGLAVKAPMWPFHSWLPDAHTAAPTAASVLLAGVLLKMGTYGMVRILLPSVPSGMRLLAPLLAVLAVVGIWYGAAATYAQRDLKRLIAFSSVAHMGFVLLGIASLTTIGVNGALFGNIAHGLITGLLFFLSGVIRQRHGTLDLATMPRALYARAPRLGFILAGAAIASLGLPGLAGFWGEFLPMLGAYQPGATVLVLYRTCVAAAALGTVFAAAYLLRMLRRVVQGPTTTTRLRDLAGAETGAIAPLVGLVVLLGLVPGLLLTATAPAVSAVVAAASGGGS